LQCKLEQLFHELASDIEVKPMDLMENNSTEKDDDKIEIAGPDNIQESIETQQNAEVKIIMYIESL
jgi:hypothetical protein